MLLCLVMLGSTSWWMVKASLRAMVKTKGVVGSSAMAMKWDWFWPKARMGVTRAGPGRMAKIRVKGVPHGGGVGVVGPVGGHVGCGGGGEVCWVWGVDGWIVAVSEFAIGCPGTYLGNDGGREAGMCRRVGGFGEGVGHGGKG